MTSSKIYPSLERKPGGPDNWVEATGGLPDYIERIAKHLHYEQGMSISTAIATAVNTVKRWARKGGVVKYGDPNNKHVTTITAAQAQAAVAQWEAMKARAHTGAASRRHGRISLSLTQAGGVVDLSVLVERANRIENPTMRAQARKAVVDLAVSAASRNAAYQQGATMADKSFPIRNAEELKAAIHFCGNAKDPAAAKRHIIARAKALGLTSMIPKTWDLAVAAGFVIDLALPVAQKCKYCNNPATHQVVHSEGMAYIPCCDTHLDQAKQDAAKSTPDGTPDPSNIVRVVNMAKPVGRVIDLALTKDGRKSFKKRGRWGHGFVPLDNEAKIAKAKGSPIAMKRINRLFSGASANRKPPKAPKPGRQVKVTAPKGSPTERVARVGQAQHLQVPVTKPNQRVTPKRVEVSRGRRPDARATQPWDSIKDADKTIRNGKRYVLTTFGGQQSLTEWTGDPTQTDVTASDKKRYSSLSETSVKKLTTATIRRMLEDHTISDQVRKVLNAELRRKTRLRIFTRKAA